MRIKIAFCLLLAGLTACSGMSVEECETADWRALGYADGANGQTMQRAGQRGSECSKHGFAMNHELYNEGRQQGLVSFCTVSKAYSLGESGAAYTGVCIDHDQDAFLQAYERGLELHRFVAAVSTAQVELDGAEQDHARLDRRIQDYKKGYKQDDHSAEEHKQQVLDVWAERKWLAKEAIPHWTVELRFAQRELEDYRQKLANNDPSLGHLRPSSMKQPQAYTGPSNADSYEMMAEVLRRQSNR